MIMQGLIHSSFEVINSNYPPVGYVEPCHVICNITVEMQQCWTRMCHHFRNSPDAVAIFVHQPTIQTNTYKEHNIDTGLIYTCTPFKNGGNYMYHLFNPLAPNNGHTALLCDGFNYLTTQHMHQPITAILVQSSWGVFQLNFSLPCVCVCVTVCMKKWNPVF